MEASEPRTGGPLAALLSAPAAAGESISSKRGLGPWNPGITSTLPRRLYPRVTIFDPAHAAVPVEEIESLARYAGLPMQAVTCLSPERLMLHELLVRVTAELTIDDGPLQADLGANFRRMVSTLLERHLRPLMPDLIAAFEAARSRIDREIAAALASMIAPAPVSPLRPRSGGWGWRSLFAAPVRAAAVPAGEPDEAVGLDAIGRWRTTSETAAEPVTRAAHVALVKAAVAVVSRQGAITGRENVVHRLATLMALESYAGLLLGELIEPHFFAAAAAEGYRVLPAQSHPIVMNTKGASASGKSTLRPKQRALAERLGVSWRDFAIISPDIWRKQLLDYGSLGVDRRWAGTLTAFEVEIIDRKLDRYVAARARAGRRTHMLIDRFRFDSFAPEGAEDDATQLLTRFASEVHLFFMITPPEATVERAWSRGERVGRYKAVDDLLAHNVEAFTGMPALFFRWAASPDKEVHYEFLDNSVAEGDSPRTVAFGLNGDMVVLDLDRLVDIDRFKRINVDATCPREVYDRCERRGGSNLDFLRECIRRIPRLRFAEHRTGDVYARFERGVLREWHADVLRRAVVDAEARDSLLELIAGSPERAPQRGNSAERIVPGEHRTVGIWGELKGPSVG